MQVHHLQTLYPQFQSVLGALPDNTTSLSLYQSTDRVHFHAYPQPTFGFQTSTFTNVPQELKTLFARADASLWVWADTVDAAMSSWSDIAICLQSRLGSALLHSNPMAGLSGYTYGDSLGIDQHLQASYFDLSSGVLQEEGSSQLSANTLSSLNEFEFLATVHSPTPSPTLASAGYDTNLYADPAWPWGQNESPGMGVLQLALQTLNTSESSHANDLSSYSIGDMPLTVNLATISPPPVDVYLSQEEDPTTSTTASSCGTSLDLSTSTSDDAVSPVSFSHSPGAQHQNSFTLSTDAAGPLSFRRHSVGAPSAPPPRMVGKKTKRDGDGSDDNDYTYPDDSYFLTTTAVTADVVAGAHTSKRRRANEGVIVKATSAPARFTVPLPNIEHPHERNDCDDEDDDSSVSSSSSSLSQSLALFTPGSASTSTTSLLPFTHIRRRRAGTSTSGGRARRTKCQFCPKTFSRAQDAQRHAATTCDASPEKAGVQCPECGNVLSRLDAAQRHWRGHENPQCETPAWANTRA
ncbi:hypothetical protein BJY52DRAFT_1299435 [Lactarius psammicola]|nr:hypothetical protein BJY52DRAFT_1299435 [Lactarius psammicola]